ncbi:hypothetical protein G6009_05495 [Dietzia sp. SLG510A3-30A2]|nr:hypothetical protein [Dietzia sp. SLG510A3-30A2]
MSKSDPTPDPRCGTRAGYKAHARRDEWSCDPCRAANTHATKKHRNPTPDDDPAERATVSTDASPGVPQLTDPDEYRRLHYPDDKPTPACAGDWRLFDPPGQYEPRDDYSARAALARKVCRWCPVLDECADRVAGLPNRDKRGFTYAGTTFDAAGVPIKNQEAAA